MRIRTADGAVLPDRAISAWKSASRGHRHRLVGPAPRNDLGVIGGGEPRFGRVHGIQPRLAEQGGGPAAHALVQEEPHEAVLRSTVSSPSIAAA